MSNSRARAWSERALKAEARVQQLEEVRNKARQVHRKSLVNGRGSDEVLYALCELDDALQSEAALSSSTSEAPEKEE